MSHKEDPPTRGAGGHSSLRGGVQKGRTWFLGIGINAYEYFPPLNNAVKDVEDFCQLLLEKYDLEQERVILLCNREAIHERIFERFDDLVERLPEEDRLIIYYSGHGHLNPVGGYWIPCDAEKDKTAHYISNSTIRDYIKAIRARHILLISDSCFSGSLFVRGASRGDHAEDELESIPSRWALCSGRHDEEVYDGEPGRNSPFAESILDTLNSNRQPVFNVAKLADRVVEQTRANYEQLPEGAPIYGVGHKGGQFIFYLKDSGPTVRTVTGNEKGDLTKQAVAPVIRKSKADRETAVNPPDGKKQGEPPSSSSSAGKTGRTGPANINMRWVITALMIVVLTVWGISKIRSGNQRATNKMNLYKYQDESSLKFGFKDRKDSIVIDPLFDRASDFKNGQARVWKEGKAFYIDEKGVCISDCPPGDAETTKPKPEPSVTELPDAEELAWKTARQRPSIEAYKLFIIKFPDSRYAAKAREELQALETQDHGIAPQESGNTEAVVNGQTVNYVQMGKDGKVVGGLFFQGNKIWKGIAGAYYTELSRDDWSVYLDNKSADEFLRIDLYTKQIKASVDPFRDEKEVYRVLKAANETAYTVRKIRFGANGNVEGYLQEMDNATWQWVQKDKTANFKELTRDDWSVYLISEKREGYFILDLYRKKIVYSTDNSQDKKDIYEILSFSN